MLKTKIFYWLNINLTISCYWENSFEYSRLVTWHLSLPRQIETECWCLTLFVLFRFSWLENQPIQMIDNSICNFSNSVQLFSFKYYHWFNSFHFKSKKRIKIVFPNKNRFFQFHMLKQFTNPSGIIGLFLILIYFQNLFGLVLYQYKTKKHQCILYFKYEFKVFIISVKHVLEFSSLNILYDKFVIQVICRTDLTLSNCFQIKIFPFY